MYVLVIKRRKERTVSQAASLLSIHAVLLILQVVCHLQFWWKHLTKVTWELVFSREIWYH